MKAGRKGSTLVMIKRMPREGSQKEEETKEKKRSLRSRVTSYLSCVDIGLNLSLNSDYYTQN